MECRVWESGREGGRFYDGWDGLWLDDDQHCV